MSGVDIRQLVPYRTPLDDNFRWSGFEHRQSDVFVCTPPKCGTTWMQTIVMALIFQGEPMPAPVAMLSPWLEMRFIPIDDMFAALRNQTHRRCIKSHTPADGIGWWDDAHYIVVGRDGRDACMSYLNHMRRTRPEFLAQNDETATVEGIELQPPAPTEDVSEFFAWWLAYNPYFRFMATFWERRARPNVLFVHFNDLKADLDGQMRRVAAFLDIAIDEERWATIVESCTFTSMKARADEIAPFELMFEGGADAFLYKGTNDRWRDVLNAAELATYARREAEMLPPEAIGWLRGDHVPGVSDVAMPDPREA